MFLSFGTPLSELEGRLSLQEIRLGVGSFLRREQMVHLQNYENLVMIVSKAFGGTEDDNIPLKPTKKSGTLSDLQSFVADANNF